MRSRPARAVLARVASRTPDIEPRDLFLIYVPEDRLPVAAPLAVELTKRRVSVAFADYEVATAQQLTEAVAHGLAHHRAAVVVFTQAHSTASNRTLPRPTTESGSSAARSPHAVPSSRRASLTIAV